MNTVGAMQVDQEIDHTHRIITLTLTGDLSDEGLLGLADRLEQIPGVTPDYSLLIDLRRSKGRKITTAGIRKMAKRRLALAADSRRAVVVPNLLAYGVAKTYEVLRGQNGAMRVFIDFDDAYRWIQTGTARST